MKRARMAILLAMLTAGIGAWIYFKRLDSSFDPPYSLIDDCLYLGRAVRTPPPGTNAVVNVCGIEDRYAIDATFWRPVFEGGEEPDLKWLSDAVDFIRAQRNSGNTVYVHCLAGTNRSPTVVAAYLMQARQWSAEKAVSYVQAKRPQAQPNPEMMRLLAKYGDEQPNSANDVK